MTVDSLSASMCGPASRPAVRGTSTVLAFLLLCSVTRSAPADAARAAAPAASPQSGSVRSPRLMHDPGVAYPEAALAAGTNQDVDVDLVIEVAADGGVRDVQVTNTVAREFAEAALEAAKQLRFEPAQREGRAVPARIRFRYHFVAPEAQLQGRLRAADTRTPIANVRVVVRFPDGKSQELRSETDGTFRLSRPGTTRVRVDVEGIDHAPQQAELELQAGRVTQADFELEARPAAAGGIPPKSYEPVEILVEGERRAPVVTSFTREEVRTLPGAFGDPFRAIEAMPGVTPIVSGLPFFYVRGAPPGNVGYFLDGIEVPYLYHVGIGPSVVSPALVERVDLYPGGYPARFGRFAGGIVAAETTEPTTTLRGEGNLRLFDVGALLETSFANGKGTLLLGGRYSYTAALFSLLVPDLQLDYRDYQLRLTYELGRRDRVSVFGFGAYDLLAQKQPGGTNVLFGSEFYRLDIRHDHDFGSGKLRTAVTLGFDQSHTAGAGNVQDRSLGVRVEYRQQLARDLLLRARMDATTDRYSSKRPSYYDPDDPGVIEFARNFPGRSDYAGGVAADVVWDATRHVQVTPGLRFDLYASGDAVKPALDPRIAARFRINERFAIVHAYGLAHQPPAFVVPVPGLSPATLKDGLQQSAQASAGVELRLGSATKATFNLFYNAFFSMSDAFSANDGTSADRLNQRSLGSGYGIELHINRKMSERLAGFLSYTLSRSTRSVGSEHFPATFDRTHVANAALAYQLGRGWLAGVRGVFYTGSPKLTFGPGNRARSAHPERNPPFFRLDVRLEKRWTLAERRYISLVAEVLNATLSKEQFGDEVIGPITVPSLGLEAGF